MTHHWQLCTHQDLFKCKNCEAEIAGPVLKALLEGKHPLSSDKNFVKVLEERFGNCPSSEGLEVAEAEEV